MSCHKAGANRGRIGSTPVGGPGWFVYPSPRFSSNLSFPPRGTPHGSRRSPRHLQEPGRRLEPRVLPEPGSTPGARPCRSAEDCLLTSLLLVRSKGPTRGATARIVPILRIATTRFRGISCRRRCPADHGSAETLPAPASTAPGRLRDTRSCTPFPVQDLHPTSSLEAHSSTALGSGKIMNLLHSYAFPRRVPIDRPPFFVLVCRLRHLASSGRHRIPAGLVAPRRLFPHVRAGRSSRARARRRSGDRGGCRGE